ncbi:MAG: response regulator transcription factor [Bacteroidota bacterium]
MKKKILIVDDERDIVDLLKYNIKKEGYEVYTAGNGEEAIEQMKLNPNLVLLDVMMPKRDGWEVAREIRSKKEFDNTSIIFLTAKSNEIDEVHGLRIADDYVVKPISMPTLLARIKLRLNDKSNKKISSSTVKEIYKYKTIEVDRDKYKVFINKKEIFFPRKEFELLSFMIKNVGKILPRELILSNIWGSEVFVGDRTIDVHIRKLREKLTTLGKEIETIKGVGYRLNED